MKRKGVLVLVLMIIVVLSVFAKGTEEQSADVSGSRGVNEYGYDLTDCKPIEAIFPAPNGSTAVDTIYGEKWMNLVEERSNGLITFDYTNSGALGSPAELMEGIDMGAYDISMVDLANFGTYVPQVDVLCLPYIIKDYEHARNVFSGEPFEWVKDQISEKMDVVTLSSFASGFRNVCSKDPLKTLADCEGYLIRSPAVELYLEALGRLGFKCTTISYAEMYSAMSAGIINAVETTLNVLYESGYYDLGKYILETRHFFSCSLFIVNSDFWANLPETYRKIMTDAIDEVTEQEWEYCIQIENDYHKKFADKGVTIYNFSDQDHKEILNRFDDYWRTKASAMGFGTIEMVEKLIKLQGK